jgi:hypothetical protein
MGHQSGRKGDETTEWNNPFICTEITIIAIREWMEMAKSMNDDKKKQWHQSSVISLGIIPHAALIEKYVPHTFSDPKRELKTAQPRNILREKNAKLFVENGDNKYFHMTHKNDK